MLVGYCWVGDRSRGSERIVVIADSTEMEGIVRSDELLDYYIPIRWEIQ